MWQQDLDLATQETLSTLSAVVSTGLSYSVHLPIALCDYPFHVFSAYFLDPDVKKREASFKLVEDNLKLIAPYRPDFCVIHFSGVYSKVEALEGLSERLNEGLERLNKLAKGYGTRLYLEYFGFNEHLLTAQSWAPILNYSHLGILLDTGHLLFSARLHQLSFQRLFLEFLPLASAVHLWNTLHEPGAYEDAEGYMAYHHLVPRLEQTPTKGYGLDMQWLFEQLRATDLPVIFEASVRHGPSGTLEEGLRAWRLAMEKGRLGPYEEDD